MIVAIFELHALSSLWLSSTSLLITFLPLNFLESPSFWSSSVVCNFCPSFISSSFGDSNLSPSGVFLPFFTGVIFLNFTFVSSLDGSFSCLGSSSCDLKYKSFNEGFDVSETTFSDTTLSASELVLSPGCLYSSNLSLSLSSSFGTDASSTLIVLVVSGSSLGSFLFFLSLLFLCFFFPFLDSSSGCFSSSFGFSSSLGFSSGFSSSFGFSSSGNFVDSTLVTCWAFVPGNT